MRTPLAYRQVSFFTVWKWSAGRSFLSMRFTWWLIRKLFRNQQILGLWFHWAQLNPIITLILSPYLSLVSCLDTTKHASSHHACSSTCYHSAGCRRRYHQPPPLLLLEKSILQSLRWRGRSTAHAGCPVRTGKQGSPPGVHQRNDWSFPHYGWKSIRSSKNATETGNVQGERMWNTFAGMPF